MHDSTTEMEPPGEAKHDTGVGAVFAKCTVPGADAVLRKRRLRDHRLGIGIFPRYPSSTISTPVATSTMPRPMTQVSGSRKSRWDSTAVRATPPAAQMP